MVTIRLAYVCAALSMTVVTLGCPAKVATIEITPAKTLIKNEADTKTLVATPKDGDGTAIEGKVPTWSSSDPAVASVDSSGKVKPAGTGKTTITAKVDEMSGTAEVEVKLLKSIKLESPAMVIKAGVSNAPLKVAFMNEKGEPVELADAKVEWKSADPNIATVGPDGAVKGVAPGSTTVNARVNELSADVAVTVNPGDPGPDAGVPVTDAGVPTK